MHTSRSAAEQLRIVLDRSRAVCGIRAACVDTDFLRLEVVRCLGASVEADFAQ